MEQKTVSNSTWISEGYATEFNPQLAEALFDGLIPGIRIPAFLTTSHAKEIAAAVARYVRDYKDAKLVGRVGEALVDSGDDFDDYAKHAAVWLAKGISLQEREDLLNQVIGYLTINSGKLVRLLTFDGKKCFAGIFRKVNGGAGIHVDIISADSKAFSDRRVKFQGSLLVHCDTTGKGGATNIYSKVPEPSDIKHRFDSWQYSPDFLSGYQKVTIPCVAGDFVFLPTNRYHSVDKMEGVGADRISFGVFTVIFEDEPNVIYLYN